MNGTVPGPAPGAETSRTSEIFHGAMRGTIAAMAMSGMRQFTAHAGIIEQSPPDAILSQRARGLLRKVPKRRRRVLVEALHWTYGAAGGAAFAALPESVRQRAWAGPVYGLAVWLGYEAAIAPGLGLQQAKEGRIVERVAFAVDHLLYGFILAETRRRPQE